VRVLAPADAAKLWSPWNLAYLAASISGAFLGAHLSGDDLPSLGIVALSAVSAAVVMRIDLGDAWRKGVIGFLVAVLGMVGIAAIDTRFDSNRVVLLTLPWVIVAGTYVGFRLQSYHSLKGLLDGLTKLGDVIAKGLARIVVGKKTWDGIKRD
jgi:MFS-type transporter involved in bile tolerance (Atg22 family)